VEVSTVRDKRRLLGEEAWERVREAYLLEGRSAKWISEQPWGPSRPTVTRAIARGIDVRTPTGQAISKPPIESLKPAVQSAMRASKGAARVLAVVEAVATGDTETAAIAAEQPIRVPVHRTRGRRTLPPAQSAEPTGHPDEVEHDGITPKAVLRELARLDGAQTLIEETTMLRDGKATAYDVLLLAQAMVADGRIIQGKISAALAKLEIETPLDVLLAVKINSAITLAVDRGTRVMQRVLELERELLGDPRDATGATGAPGETFAMTEEEALAELRRCSHVAERYGVPFAVGSRAELPAQVVNQQDVRQEEPPHVFVSARDDEQGDASEQTDTE
jgi:hypothetical protein